MIKENASNTHRTQIGLPREQTEARRFQQLQDLAHQLDNSPRDANALPDQVEFSARNDDTPLIQLEEFEVGQLVMSTDDRQKTVSLIVDGFTSHPTTRADSSGIRRHVDDYKLYTAADSLEVNKSSLDVSGSQYETFVLKPYSQYLLR